MKIKPHLYHRDAYLAAWKLRKTKKLNSSEIARRLGLSRETVSLWLRTNERYGTVLVQAPNISAYKKVLKILQMKELLSAYKIARMVGVPETLVCYWIKKEWEHAERDK